MSNAIHRALVAVDAKGVPRLLATDSATVAFFVDEVGTDCEEIGLCSAREAGPGLFLWKGCIRNVNNALYDEPAEWEPEFDGALSPVTSMTEAVELFAMSPPEPPEPDDRESQEPG